MARLVSGPPDAKVNADGFRTYRWPNPDGTDRELMSVTSIRKLVGEPFGLVAWQIGKVLDRALSEEYRRRWNGTLSSSEAMDDDGQEFMESSPDPMLVAELRKWLRAASTEERDVAAGKGLDIHGALELGLTPEQCNEETRPYIRQVYHFLADTGWKIAAQEQQCWNLSVGYAGTLDVIFETQDGRYVLGDWKSSKNVYTDHVVQLHAYLGGEFIGTGGVVDERLTAILASIQTAGILHLRPDGWSWYDVPYDEDVLRAFFGSVKFAQLLAANPKPDALFSGKRSGRAE